MAECFELALRARNRLNHGFFERHNFAIFAEGGREAMIAELEVIHIQIVAAYDIAQPASMQLLARVQAARGSS